MTEPGALGGVGGVHLSLAGAFLCVIILLLFPFVTTLWMGVLCLWLLDAGNNTSMEPYRALISDKLPKSQLARGFLTQSLFTGAGAVLANLSLFIFQKVLGGTAANGVPYWVYTCFALGAVCILVTVLTAMLRTKEVPPSERRTCRASCCAQRSAALCHRYRSGGA